MGIFDWLGAKKTKAVVEQKSNKIAQEQKFDLIVSRLSTVYNNSQDEITIQTIADMGKLAK